MQYSTFAAIDIGSYDVILEIFEISKKQGIRSVDKICHRMELGKDTYTLGKIRPEMEEELCRVLADFVRIMEGYRVDDYRATASSAISEASNSLYVLGKIHQLTGLSVTVLSNSEQRFLSYKALAAMEDVALWHERDISHSSVERIILPDATELLDYMLVLMTRILGDLFVYPENMLRSMSMSYGLPNSQHVLLTLIDKGMLRETAYDCVQRCAMRAWQEQKPFRQMLEQDETVTSHLSPAELDECFELSYHYKHVDEVFKRLGLEK